MKTRGGRRYVTLLLCLSIIKHVKTDGKLDIRFISYWSNGKEMSGHCCDSGFVAGCIDKCDPMFYLCIDGPDGKEQCSLYMRTTNFIDNHNTITFGSSIQGTANPFIIQLLKAVPSSIKITVQVYDNDDTSSDDHMDKLSMRINIQAAATEQTAVYTPYTLWKRTKLQIQVRAYCDPDWYGSGCETYCKATPDQSHYTCNKHTGAKMCFKGWKGDNCDQDIDECEEINSWCQNGGSCTNTHGSFQCICMEGIKGRRCEIITNQCALEPCLNGGTCDGNQTDFNCSCSVKWTGETCAEMVNFCDSAPCNRGNCTHDLLTATRFKCNCDFAWVGERCGRSVDIINITLLGAIDHTNKGNLTDGLHRLITELGEIPGEVDVKITTNKHTESNFTTTYVQLYSSLENDTFLDSASVNTIFESNRDEVLNKYLPLPLYPPRQEEKSTVKRPHDNWDTVHYVPAVLLPLGLVLMTVLILVAICIWRRKSDKSQCTDDDNNDQINSLEMDVPCNRYPQSPGTITGNLQDASPDSKPCLDFHDVHEGALDTHCDDTSNIHRATGDVTLDPWSQEAASVSLDDNARYGDLTPLDTHRHATSNTHNGTGDMTLVPWSQEAASVSLDDNARHGDLTPLDTHRHATSNTHNGTRDMTLVPWSQEAASVSVDDNARYGDLTPLDTHRHATSNTHNGTGDMTLVPWSQEAASVSLDDNARHGDLTPLDTHRHATSNTHNGTGDMTLVPWSQEAASVSVDDNARHGDITPLDTHRHATSNTHNGTLDMTLVPWSQEAASVSPDDNARHGDITPLDTHRHATSNTHNGTGDMTLDLSSLHGASVSESVDPRHHDEATLEARHYVAAHLPVDVLHLHQTINYEPLDRCEEEDTDSTVTDDTNVENISEEDPYVDVVVLNM